jgi:hypothetical protein
MGDHSRHVVDPPPQRPRAPQLLAEAPLDDLLREVGERVRGARGEQQRWRLLLDAVVSLAADLTLDELLTRIVEVAADLAQANAVTADCTASSRTASRPRRPSASGTCPRGTASSGW